MICVEKPCNSKYSDALSPDERNGIIAETEISSSDISQISLTPLVDLLQQATRYCLLCECQRRAILMKGKENSIALLLPSIGSIVV
jgi:hypothetical protein